MRHALRLIGLAMLLAAGSAAGAPPLGVVAAENFYGDLARQIGGEQVEVVSIIGNPDQDPHLFETSPTVVRHIAAARVVIYNGAGYDAWMDRLLKASPRSDRLVINVADLAGKARGDNPHLWYDPSIMPKVAQVLADALTRADPAHRRDYAERLTTFLASLKPLNDKIAAIAGKYAGTPVTASEPVFGYMAAALKLTMRNERFQRAVMNDTEPSAADIAAFEDDLKTHKVRVMFYNKQAVSNAVRRLVTMAQNNNIPVVGVTETAPPGQGYVQWMLSELDATERALARSSQ
ncbi:MAG: zinc ABC transporter substrate-binding protein [Pseudolabrys sp.]|nr:zinc ABC transporter substrate-binding protein [Pseudolabrys sp.]